MPGPKLPSSKNPEIVLKSETPPPPKYHDKILYSPMDNQKTWDNVTRPGMRTTKT